MRTDSREWSSDLHTCAVACVCPCMYTHTMMMIMMMIEKKKPESSKWAPLQPPFKYHTTPTWGGGHNRTPCDLSLWCPVWRPGGKHGVGHRLVSMPLAKNPPQNSARRRPFKEGSIRRQHKTSVCKTVQTNALPETLLCTNFTECKDRSHGPAACLVSTKT